MPDPYKPAPSDPPDRESVAEDDRDATGVESEQADADAASCQVPLEPRESSLDALESDAPLIPDYAVPVEPVVGPVSSGERIDSIDVLRGVAVLGILVMNIQSFSMPEIAYDNPTAYGDLTGANYWVWWGSHVFAELKFITIFSMLFGAGMLVMVERRHAAGLSASGLHYRRMFILLLIGMAHGYLLWHGDILYAYAVCGMALFALYWAPAWLLLALSMAGLLIGNSYFVSLVRYEPHWSEFLQAYFTEVRRPPPMSMREEIAVYSGSWSVQMEHRPYETLRIQTYSFLIYIMWRVGATVLLGMALHKLGVFTARLKWWIYALMLVAGAGLGFPLVVKGVLYNEAHGWLYTQSFFYGRLFNYWGSVPAAFAWIGLVMLICKANFLHAVTRPFAAVGRMAFTNYLMQTVICTTIFYGQGFGLFGELERVQQLQIVVAICTLQLVYSPIWLKYFRFGPAEWIWRSLTYMRPQPMRVVHRSLDEASAG